MFSPYHTNREIESYINFWSSYYHMHTTLTLLEIFHKLYDQNEHNNSTRSYNHAFIDFIFFSNFIWEIEQLSVNITFRLYLIWE